MEVITDVSPWALLKHLHSWIGNLNRAGKQRRLDSVAALRQVVVSARETHAYVRYLTRKKVRDEHREANIAAHWTELGFRLSDLGLGKLAKRCDIKGKPLRGLPAPHGSRYTLEKRYNHGYTLSS